MADKPQDLKPATEFGEVKVIKNERKDPAGKTPSPESGALDDAQQRSPGKPSDQAEG